MVASSSIHYRGGNHPQYQSTRRSKLAKILRQRDEKERLNDARNKCYGQKAIFICKPQQTISKPLIVSSRTFSTASCSSSYTKNTEYPLRDEKVDDIENESVMQLPIYSHGEMSSSEETEPSQSMHSDVTPDKIKISGLQRRAYLRELRNDNSRQTISKPLLVSTCTISTASCSSAYTKNTEDLLRDEKVDDIENESVTLPPIYSHEEISSSEEIEPSQSTHSEETHDKIKISGLQRRAYLRELRNEKSKKKISVTEGRVNVVDTRKTNISNLLATAEDMEGISRDEKDSLLCMSDDLLSDSSYCLSNELEKDFVYRQMNQTISQQFSGLEAVVTECESFAEDKSLVEDAKFKQEYQGMSDDDDDNASFATKAIIRRQKSVKHTMEERRAYLRELRTKIYNKLDTVGDEKAYVKDTSRTKKSDLKKTDEDEEDLSTNGKDSLLSTSHDSSLSHISSSVRKDSGKDYGYKMILNPSKRRSQSVMTENGLSPRTGSHLTLNREEENQHQYREARDKNHNDCSNEHVNVGISSTSKSTVSHKKRFDHEVSVSPSHHCVRDTRKATTNNRTSVSKDTGPNVTRQMHRNNGNVKKMRSEKSVRVLGKNKGHRHGSKTLPINHLRAIIPGDQNGSSRYTSENIKRARDIVHLRKQSPRMATSNHSTPQVSWSNLTGKNTEAHNSTFYTPELFCMKEQQHNGQQGQKQKVSFVHQQPAIVPTLAPLKNGYNKIASVNQEARRRFQSQELGEQMPNRHNHFPIFENDAPNRMHVKEQEAQKRIEKMWCRKYPPFRPLERMNVGVTNHEKGQDISNPSDSIESNNNDGVQYASSYGHRPDILYSHLNPGQTLASPARVRIQSPMNSYYLDGEHEEIVQFNKIIHPSYNSDRERISKRMHRAKKWGKAKEGKREPRLNVDPSESSFDSGTSCSRRTHSLTSGSASLGAPKPAVEEKKHRKKNIHVPPHPHKEGKPDNDFHSGDKHDVWDDPRRQKEPELVVEISDRTNAGMATVMDAGDGIEVGYETSQDSQREKHRSAKQLVDLTTCSSECSKSTENESVSSEQSASTSDSMTFIDSSDSTFGESSERDLAQKFWSLFV